MQNKGLKKRLPTQTPRMNGSKALELAVIEKI